MSAVGDEFVRVEQPLMVQLEALGWQTMDGDTHVPEFSERGHFREVLLESRLRRALGRINPWLDEQRIDQVVHALHRVHAPRLIEANQEGTGLLIGGIPVEAPAGEGGRRRTVRLIDFDEPANNDLLAVRQFRVDGLSGRTYIVPDAVLFVNGIPLVVVECKSPAATDPIGSAITQLRRYAGRGEEGDEGAEHLFHFNQLLVATCFDQARVGVVGAGPEHFLEWKDPTPRSHEEVRQLLQTVEPLSAQQVLAAGLLAPDNLLDVLRHFTLFQRGAGRTVKVVARYQQFRAVHAAVERLRRGQTRRQTGDIDRRGGIIWHTQGSGKSLTMTFLVRKMRGLPELRRFKVVVVTDRTDLEDQLRRTAALAGEPVHRARDSEDLKRLLSRPGADLVFAMIQKYQDRDEPTGWESAESFGVLNESEEILVLVDEAHRSHTSTLHANLLRALPNCARIGFTGTPILMGAARKTHEIFGDFLDRYTMTEAEADGATAPIRYAGWGVRYCLEDGQSLDELFEGYFAAHSDEEREAIRATYATRFSVMEREAVLGAKAEHMLRHYIDTVLPSGLKAQVVAVSRKAAVKYCEVLETLLGEWLHELENLDPGLLALSEEELAGRDEHTRWLVRAHARLDTLRRLRFGAIISGGPNDPPAWREWSDPARQAVLIERFKKPLHHADPESQDGLAFLCVKSMLLTGFDAPVEGVLYLDRPMRGHELLQAIARVNRPHPGKHVGLIVDYCGVTRHLTEALAAYNADDVAGAMRSLRDELPTLEERHRRAVEVFRGRGIQDLTDRAACVDLLADLRIRSDFTAKLRAFLQSLDVVLPRPEGLPFVEDAQALGRIHVEARNRYRDADLRLEGAGPKVEDLIDRHLRVQGLDPKVGPLDLTAPNFLEAVDAQPTAKARASEMEHALRHHIDVHLDEDPVHFRKLSERLQEVLRQFEDDWESVSRGLRLLVEDARLPGPAGEHGLDARQAPFYRVLAEEVPGEEMRGAQLAGMCVGLVAEISREIGKVDFWRNPQLCNGLRDRVTTYLDDHDLVPFSRQEEVAGRLVELARALHTRLREHE